MSDYYHKISPRFFIKKIWSAPLNVYKNKIGLSLDMSYITPNIIVCSNLVTKYPKLLYRNSLNDLINYLVSQHGPNRWKIYNLKGERNWSDYSDEDLLHLAYTCDTHFKCLSRPICINNNLEHGKSISVGMKGDNLLYLSDVFFHQGWLDHCPPPFLTMQIIVDNIHKHLTISEFNVAVIHCRMGKGRSGTIVIAYLMKYLECPFAESRDTFMNGRFRAGMSKGVTIHSQLRYLRYHENFIKFDSDVQRTIITQLENNHKTFNFRIESITLNDPTNFLHLKSSCIITIKIETYNTEKNGLTTISTLNADGDKSEFEQFYDVDSIDEDSNKLKIICPLDIPYDITDLRIHFGINTKNTNYSSSSAASTPISNDIELIGTTEKLAENLTSKISYSAFWFNLYWESIKCIYCEFPNISSIEDLIIKQEEGQVFTTTVQWDELDGPKGTNKKGLKLFESATINWKIK